MKKIIFIILFSIIALNTYAQTAAGTVFDQKGNPLIGVAIKALESKVGTTTDFDGKFTLDNIKNKEILEFSYIGFATIQQQASSAMNVQMLLQETELDLVVVTASRTVQKRKELPVAISAISRATIEEVQPTSVDQVLNQKPGIHMVDLGNEQHMMAIRQPISTKGLFLYLEDGIPIRPTGVFNHNSLLEMNMEATKNIEVIRGPYSSLYGSESIGGAINFITENPSKELTGKIGLKGHADGYFRMDGKVSQSFGKLGIYIGGYYSQIKNGIRDYGDYNKTAITAKITYDFNDNLHWSNTLTYVDYFSEMSGSLDEVKFANRDYTSYHTFTFRDANALRFNSSFDKKWNDKNSATLSLIFRDNSMGQNPSYRIANDTPFDNHTSGELNDNSFNSYAMYFQHNIKLESLKGNLSIGTNLDYSPKTYYAQKLDVYRNLEGMFESYTNTGVYMSDYGVDIVNTGFFAAGDIALAKDLKLNAALRYDIYSYDFDNHLDAASAYSSADAKETFTSFTPRLGFAYSFTKNIGAYTNYSVGFIPPSISDLFKKTDVPLLDPTTFNSYEVGAWLSLLDHKLYIDFALYNMQGKDEVVSVTTRVLGVTTRENKNVGESSHKGVEFGFKYKPNKQFTIRYNGAYSKHEYISFITKIVDGVTTKDYSGNEMQGAPHWVTNANIDYKPNYLKGFRIGLEWQHVSDYFTDIKNENTYDGYDTFNLRMGYNKKGFGLFLNIMNLTDELYSTRVNTAWGRTDYTPGMPQTFLFGINYKFGKK
jgi:outer membrane receptor protein involved in Fe transport